MTAVAAIVLADAQATPVNHTFIPLGPDAQGVWWFEDQTGTSPIGYNRVSISLTRPSVARAGAKSQDRVSRCRIGVFMPSLETVSNNSAGFTPSPTVAYVQKCSIELLLAERGVLQNRKDLRKFAKLVLDDAQVVAAIELLQAIY